MNKNNYDDDYLDELEKDITNEMPIPTQCDNSSLTTQSPKDDLGQTQSTEEDEQSLNSTNSNLSRNNDMETIDGKHVLSPLTPRKTAEIFIAEKYRNEICRTLQCSPLKGEFYRWVDGRYQMVTDFQLKSEIGEFLAFSLQKKKDELGKDVIVSFTTSSAKETEVLSSVKNICLGSIPQDPGKGASWIHGIEEKPDASMMVPFKNRLLSISDFLKDEKVDPYKCLMPLTPQFFDTTQIPFNIVPEDYGKILPMNFIHLLEDYFDEDYFDEKSDNRSSIKFIQQWFGYCLTNMTWAHKMLLMIGPKRSGKGTIAKVLQSMLGSSNVTNPSASSLTERFPLEAWPNKKLAIFGDARFSDKKETVKEILLRISGGDEVNIERKTISSLTNVLLPIKIMILSNDLLTIRDPSGALSSRFITLKFTKSFFEKEDPHLFENKLKPEVPLIFWWALDGLRELMKVGKFVQPKCGLGVIQQMKRYESPVTVFVEEFCELDPLAVFDKGKVHEGYKLWCEQEGCRHLEKSPFVNQVLSAFCQLGESRPEINGKRVRCFNGLKLKNH